MNKYKLFLPLIASFPLCVNATSFGYVQYNAMNDQVDGEYHGATVEVGAFTSVTENTTAFFFADTNAYFEVGAAYNLSWNDALSTKFNASYAYYDWRDYYWAPVAEAKGDTDAEVLVSAINKWRIGETTFAVDFAVQRRAGLEDEGLHDFTKVWVTPSYYSPTLKTVFSYQYGVKFRDEEADPINMPDQDLSEVEHVFYIGYTGFEKFNPYIMYKTWDTDYVTGQTKRADDLYIGVNINF